MARPVRGSRRQGAAAGRPGRRTRRAPGRRGSPPAPGPPRLDALAARAREQRWPRNALAARAMASSPPTDDRRPGCRARSTASWPTSRAPAWDHCAAAPKPGGARPPATWPSSPACSANCSARLWTRSGPAGGGLRDLLTAPGGDPRRRPRRGSGPGDVTILTRRPGRGPRLRQADSGDGSVRPVLAAPPARTRSSSRCSAGTTQARLRARLTSASCCRYRPRCPARSRRCTRGRCR